jgi:MoxR-like ATPase
MDYPEIADERRILAETTTSTEPDVSTVATGADLEAARRLVRDLPAASNVVDYAMRLTRATRPADESAPSTVKDWVRWGAGPRAGQSLLLGAKAAALLDGRTVPSPDDVTAVALPVLRHRVLVNFHAEADGVDADQVIRRLLGAIKP